MKAIIDAIKRNWMKFYPEGKFERSTGELWNDPNGTYVGREWVEPLIEAVEAEFWIPCSDRLPDEVTFGWSAPVQCFGPTEDYDDQFVGSYSHLLKTWRVCGDVYDRSNIPVTHWKPLMKGPTP